MQMDVDTARLLRESAWLQWQHHATNGNAALADWWQQKYAMLEAERENQGGSQPPSVSS